MGVPTFQILSCTAAPPNDGVTHGSLVRQVYCCLSFGWGVRGALGLAANRTRGKGPLAVFRPTSADARGRPDLATLHPIALGASALPLLFPWPRPTPRYNGD
jgi:hypothetical protein